MNVVLQVHISGDPMVITAALPGDRRGLLRFRDYRSAIEFRDASRGLAKTVPVAIDRLTLLMTALRTGSRILTNPKPQNFPAIELAN